MSASEGEGEQPSGAEEGVRAGRAALWGAAAVVVAAVITGVFSLWGALISDGEPPPGEAGGAGSVAPAPTGAQEGAPGAGTAAEGIPEDGEAVRLRPSRAPELCLSEGRVRDGSYRSAVAVQRPCAGAVPPRTSLERAGGGAYRIVWEHPAEGPGCLMFREEAPAKGMLEPWPAKQCDRAARFRLEAVGASAPGAYRLRIAEGQGCVGIAGGAEEEGAEAVRKPCSGAASQVFLIDRG